MRERVDQLGVAEPEIQRSGADQIDVSLPGVKNAREAEDQVGKTAQLFFYDWETNVIGPDFKPAPEDPNVTGGPSAGSAAAIPKYDAVLRASKVKLPPETDDTTNGQLFGLNTKTPGASSAARRTSSRGAPRRRPAPRCGRSAAPRRSRRTRSSRSRRASSSSRPSAPTTTTDKDEFDRWFVLKDDPALRGTDIKNPEQNFDNGTGGTGQPNVTFDFTSKGRDVWQDVTRAIAQRGQESALPGVDPQSAAQHFAIVLDDELISVPFIDFQQNPDGIDGRNGSEISGGFTIKSAQRLANLLKTGALPVKLELISPLAGLRDARQAGARTRASSRAPWASRSSRCSC